MDSDTIREEKQSGEARRMNKVLFWVVFLLPQELDFSLLNMNLFLA